MNQEFDKLIEENERLRRELDEANSKAPHGWCIMCNPTHPVGTLCNSVAPRLFEAEQRIVKLEAREKEYIAECNKHFDAVQVANKYSAKLEAELKMVSTNLARLEYLHRVALGIDELTDEMDNLSPDDDIESISDMALYEQWRKQK